MGDPINDGFIEMCRDNIPDPYMANEFAFHFCRLEPQFNSRTRINLASFSDNKLMLAQDGSYINDMVRIRQPKSGVKAWLYRSLFSVLRTLQVQSRWNSYRLGWETVPSPYAPYPVRRRLPVKSVARSWMRSRADFPGPHDMWNPITRFDEERFLAQIWYVYDGLTDTLYIEWRRDWLR